AERSTPGGLLPNAVVASVRRGGEGRLVTITDHRMIEVREGLASQSGGRIAHFGDHTQRAPGAAEDGSGLSAVDDADAHGDGAQRVAEGTPHAAHRAASRYRRDLRICVTCAHD
ncbi:MAG: hypothetical protein ACK55I_49985, partial [bacterium]